MADVRYSRAKRSPACSTSGPPATAALLGVETTLESVAVLGIIVVIRILLSFALEVEIDGLWPWRRWQLDRNRDTKAPSDNS